MKRLRKVESDEKTSEKLPAFSRPIHSTADQQKAPQASLIMRQSQSQLKGTLQTPSNTTMSGTLATSDAQLAGKVAIITGASRGVGAELARVYAREGASVVVNYFQSEEKAHKVVESIVSNGGQAIAVRGDVTSKDDMVAMASKAVETYGKIDVLVNNALASYKFDATSSMTSIKTIEWENCDQQFQGTIRGAVNAVQAVLPHMETNKYGKIVNIGTNLMYNPVVPYYDYTTAKAALVGLTRNLAKELGPSGIRVNLVAGGLLQTTDASSLTSEEVFGFVAQSTPLRKSTTVNEFAEACVYFAAKASDAVTGQSLSVDGGLTMP